MTHTDYVSPRTLRRRRGRAIRKARRATRARIDTLTVTIRAVMPAFAAIGVALSGVDRAFSLAYSRMRALEGAAASVYRHRR